MAGVIRRNTEVPRSRVAGEDMSRKHWEAAAVPRIQAVRRRVAGGACRNDWGVLRLKNIAHLDTVNSTRSRDRIPGNMTFTGLIGSLISMNGQDTKGPCLIIGRKGSIGKVADIWESLLCDRYHKFYCTLPLTRNDLRWSLSIACNGFVSTLLTKDSAVHWPLARETPI